MKASIYQHKHSGIIRIVEWNPCNCCPLSTIETWGNRFKECGSYYYKNKNQFYRWAKERGYKYIGKL